MVLEFITEMFTQAAQVNNLLTIALLFVLIFIGYKIFQIVLKSVIVGIIAALIPVGAIVLGVDIGVSLSISNMLWFAVFGVMSYLVYASVNAGVKTVKLIMKPFGVLFRNKPKQKVIIKQEKKEED